MFPQHGGVPNFSMRIRGPMLAALSLVLVIGILVTLSFYMNADEGDVSAQNRAKLSLIITTLLTIFVLLAATGRWWHPHLWRRGNSQKHHRHRSKRSHSGRRHH